MSWRTVVITKQSKLNEVLDTTERVIVLLNYFIRIQPSILFMNY